MRNNYKKRYRLQLFHKDNARNVIFPNFRAKKCQKSLQNTRNTRLSHLKIEEYVHDSLNQWHKPIVKLL